MRFRFGDCTFDGDTRQVERAGQVVHLSPKAFHLLELLLECRPKALSKQDLQERIWPDTFVSEANLASLAAEVREAIGDDSHHPRFLRTVYGFGYAFSGEAVSVEADAPGPRRRQCVIDSGREIELLPGENIVGRDVDAAVRLDDPTVSRHHARITKEGDSAVLEDLGSKNGTFVEGRRIRKPVKLKSGSVLTFGSVHVRFRAFSPESSTETVGSE
jgi:DNA-binding winged helix-turn-helix (wHTH) protein